MKKNAIQFAVVREDPEVERAAVDDSPPRRALLIGSGGCTALHLQACWPETGFTLVDPNRAQIELVQQKVAALERGAGLDEWNALSQCGNFESLFRMLRSFLHEFVLEPEAIRSWFDGADPTQTFAADYWQVAFELMFADPMLETMFGPAATQHAKPGSYPGYFRERLERGLLAEGMRDNYFLHHIFLGEYLPHAVPAFLAHPAAGHRFTFVHGMLDSAPHLSDFDFIHLSNIMDWMTPNECEPMVARIRAEARRGTSIVWRQLNNDRDREAWFGDAFVFDAQLGTTLAAQDRSLFYSSIHVGRKES